MIYSEKYSIFSEQNKHAKMTQTIEKKIESRINGHGKGWAFTKIDFASEFTDDNIHKALSSLTKAGKIRRISQGIYDFPRYSKLLDQPLSPDIDQVAHALARKFNWRIQPSGDAALNLLGLSTQVPGRWAYLSDGPHRQYEISGTTLTFKKTALKNVGFKYAESGLIVQALKALGRDHITPDVIQSTRTQIDSAHFKRILSDTRTVTSWIYDAIKQICKEAD